MHRTIRTCFTASVVTTLALAVPACGGSSKPSQGGQQQAAPMPGNPPQPDPVIAEWTVSQTGNGQCLGFDDADPPNEVHIYCPEGIGIDVSATVQQHGPDQCTAVLDPCDGECAPTPTPCPDPIESWDVDDEE